VHIYTSSDADLPGFPGWPSRCTAGCRLPASTTPLSAKSSKHYRLTARPIHSPAANYLILYETVSASGHLVAIEAFYHDLLINDPANFPIAVPALLVQGVADAVINPKAGLK